MKKITHCPLCDAGNFKFFETCFSHAQKTQYDLCLNCGLVFSNPQPEQPELEEYYRTQYEALQNNNQVSEEVFAKLKSEKNKHLINTIQDYSSKFNFKRYLDIGCSAGQLLQPIKTILKCDAVGVEPGEKYRNYLTQVKNIPVFEKIDSLIESKTEKFDLITMSHVLEHIPDPRKVLSSIHKHLIHSTGLLIIEVPNLFGHYSLEPAHLYAFSVSTLKQYLSETGFHVIETKFHNLPTEKSGFKNITVIAQPIESQNLRTNISKQKIRPSLIKWKRTIGLIQSASPLQKPRVLLGILKREALSLGQ